MSEDSEAKEAPEPPQGASSYSFAIIFITLVLSLAALGFAVNSYLTYISRNQFYEAVYATVFLIIGFLGLASSTYMLMQTRGRIMRMRIEIPPVMTTITCQKCGFKNVRTFERGDYVFKQAGPCPKCNDKLLVSAIYREVKEKPKKEIF